LANRANALDCSIWGDSNRHLMFCVAKTQPAGRTD
jgi:hypothetical protein